MIIRSIIQAIWKKMDFYVRLRKYTYTKDIIRLTNCCFGDYTYGIPEVIDYGQGTHLTVGKFVNIAGKSKFLLGGEHIMSHTSLYNTDYLPMGGNFRENERGTLINCKSKGDIVVGNDVWIGYGALILSGVKIGNGAVIAARSVVTKDVPSYAIVAGVPARSIRYRFDEKTIAALEKIAWWNWDIEMIRENAELLFGTSPERLIEKVLGPDWREKV